VAAAAFPNIEILKEFDEQTRGVASRFQIDCGGGTPMGMAMIWAASQLAPRRETRKMLIVITDGEPDNVEQVRKLVGMYEKAGVEVIGVGIGCDSVEDLYPVSVVIDSVEELAGALFGVINERMRKAA
jgi:cobaltochelatase CobT